MSMPSQSTVPVKLGIMEPFSLIRRQPPDKSTSTKRKKYESVTDCLDCSEQSGWKITISQETLGNQKRLKNDHFLVCQLEQKNSAITATNSFTSPEVTTMQEIKDEPLSICIVNFCSISIPNICTRKRKRCNLKKKNQTVSQTLVPSLQFLQISISLRDLRIDFLNCI